MKIVICPDSFKESMDAFEACQAMKNGIEKVDPTIECIVLPMADGGEGTSEVLINATGCHIQTVKVHNPFKEIIETNYGINQEGLCVMESASSCGIHLIPKERRNPTIGLSIGLGEMMLDALEKGAKEFIIGLGGTGTNDGGFGLLYALGTKFYDENNNILPCELSSILKIKTIDFSETKKKLEGISITVASDVDNVFTGNSGATYVFGPQKGANTEQLAYLESCLVHFNDCLEVDLNTILKTGAAGGLGGAFYLLGANLSSGIDMVLKVVNFEEKIKDADYIFTGEGSIDSQTIHGKTISGILKKASLYHIPVIAFAGRITSDASNLYEIGLTAMFSITNEAKSLSQALLDGKESLEQTVSNVCRLINR